MPLILSCKKPPDQVLEADMQTAKDDGLCDNYYRQDDNVHTAMIKLLLNRGADPNRYNDDVRPRHR